MRILYFALSSSLLIILVLLVRKLFRKQLSPGVLYALWLIPLLKLLMPFALVELPAFGESAEMLNAPYAIFEDAVNGLMAGDFGGFSTEEFREKEAFPEENLEAGTAKESADAEAVNDIWAEETSDLNPESGAGWVPAKTAAGQGTGAFFEKDGISWYFCLVWLWGSLGLGVYAFISNRKLRYSIRRMQTEEKVCQLPVCYSDAVVSPCLFGLFSPCILLNCAVKEDEGLYQQVLRHELTHYRQKDHIWTFLRVAMCVLYWWNPLVWAAAACSREDAELACDSRVVRRMDAGGRKEYGLALLRLLNQAQNRQSLMCSATSMSGRGKGLKRRIEGITENVSTKRRVLLPALVALAMVFLFGCAVPGGGSYVRSGWSRLRAQTEDSMEPMLEVEYKLQDTFKSRLFYYEVYQEGRLTQRNIFSYGFLDSLDQTARVLLDMPRDEENQYDSMNIILDFGTVSIEGARELGGRYGGSYTIVPLETKSLSVEPGNDLILLAAYGQQEGEEGTGVQFSCEKLMEFSEEERLEALADNGLTVMLHMVLSDLEENELAALYGEKEYPVLEGERNQGQAPDTGAEAFVQRWVNAFIDRDGDTLVGMMTEETQQRMRDNGMLGVEGEGNHFGWSSPWPMFGNELYRVLSCTEDKAEILYYAGFSVPHLYVWREILELTEENGEYKVAVDSMEMLDSINTLEDFLHAYPEGVVAGTPMDYTANGLGEVLNNNARREGSQEIPDYTRLFDPETAARELLNLAADPEGESQNEPGGVETSVEDVEGETVVHVTFRRDGSSVDIVMVQPYGEDGIWIPR